MTERKFNPEHAWVPDALGHVRWTLLRAHERAQATLVQLESLAHVVERLADALAVVEPSCPDADGMKDSGKTGRWIEWMPNRWRRETTEDRIWDLCMRDDVWTLTLNRGATGWSPCPVPLSGLAIGHYDSVTDILGDADTVIEILESVPQGSPWFMTDVFPVKLVWNGPSTEGFAWSVEELDTGSFKLFRSGNGEDKHTEWLLSYDNVSRALEESQRVIERSTANDQRFRKTTPPDSNDMMKVECEGTAFTSALKLRDLRD